MASSSFQVLEEDDNDLGFPLDDIMSTSLDSDVPRDHTYTKDPPLQDVDDIDLTNGDPSYYVRVLDEGDGDVINLDTAAEPLAKNRKDKGTKAKGKKSSPAKKTATKKKGKKQSTASPSTAIVEDMKPKMSTRKVPAKGTKRKAAEADIEENVVDESLVKDIEHLTGISSKDKSDDNPKKKAKVTKGKQAKTASKPAQKDSKVQKSTKEVLKPAKPTKSQKSKSAKSAKTSQKTSGFANPNSVDHEGLPKGWSRKTVVRQGGASAGHTDIYIFSPDGSKMRSMPDIAAYLARTKSSLKIEDFVFRATGQTSKPKKVKPTAQKAAESKGKASTPAKKTKPSAPVKGNKKLLVKIGVPAKKSGKSKKK